MILLYLHNWKYNFSSPPRLVFKKPNAEASGEGEINIALEGPGEKPKEKKKIKWQKKDHLPGEKWRKKHEKKKELAADKAETEEVEDQLEAIYDETSANRRGRKEFPDHHTERLDTRDDLKERRIPNAETRRIAEEALKMEGLMDNDDIQTMEQAQHVISSFYANPAVMLYMKTLNEHGTLSSQEIYDTLDVILKNPYAFEYIYDEVKGSVKIKKRLEGEFKNVPKVSLMIESEGFIAEVNGKKLTNPDGTFPWEGIDYQKILKDYDDRFKYEWIQSVQRNLLAPDGPYYNFTTPEEFQEAARNIQMEAFKDVTPQVQELYELHHIHIPNAFLRLFEARGFPFEQSHPGIQLLKQAMALQGKNYDELTQERDTKLKVMVVTHPDYPDAYLIYMRDHLDQTLVIHKDGYLMNEGPNGYEIDPRYFTKRIENYHEAQKAKGIDSIDLLGDDEFKKQMEEANKAGDEIDRLMENRAYMKPVEQALLTATWEQYKQIMLAFTPEEQKQQTIETLDAYAAYFASTPEYETQVKEALRLQFVERMVIDRTYTDTIAGVLGIDLTP